MMVIGQSPKHPNRKTLEKFSPGASKKPQLSKSGDRFLGAALRYRHSAITAVLNASKGDIRKSQRFSRHADPRTLIKYDDNKERMQKEMTDAISDMV